MQYPGSGPGWRMQMQRPPRGPPRGGDFGPRFGPPRGGFGPPPPPWAFRGRGGRARGGPPMRFRGPPPPHWFMAQQEFRGPSPQDVLSSDPNNQHSLVEDEATQGGPQTSPQNKDAPGGAQTTPAVSSDGVSAAPVMVATTPQTQRPKAPARPGEHEPAFDESLVLLDWFNSDLNLDIDCSDYCSVKARSSKGFGLMWAGVKATYGATKGKVCFEVSITGNNDVGHLENEPTPHVIRCGWSVSDASMQLGEEELSWGYGGTGKKSVACKFVDYGVRFGVGDILGCYLDFSSDPVVMKYTVNGKDKGIAFRIYQRELKGRALFPHILTKNQNFSVNFGQMPSPLMPLLPGFVHIGQLDVSDGLVRGPTAPAEREQCEVLMMIGLPGAGKTHWATAHAKSHPDKHYNILGTNNLIDRMKVQGLPRKRNYNGRWEALIEMCTNCFNDLMKVAAKRRRNYIIDQTNVFPTARSRKVEPFRGMTIKVVVVVPDDAEYKRRVALREAEEGKEVPDSAVHNMKANFVLPEIEETYATEVIYTELPPNEASNLVTRYNLEAEAMGVSQTSGVKNFVKRMTMTRMKLGATNVIGKHASETTGFFNPTAAAEVASPPEVPMECSSSSIPSKPESHGSRLVPKSGVNSPVAKIRPAADRSEPAKKRSETDSRDGEDGDKTDGRSGSRRSRRGSRSSRRSRKSRSRSRSDSRNRSRGRSRSPRRRRRSKERLDNKSSGRPFAGDKKPTINPWAAPEEPQVLQNRVSEDVSMRLLKESLGGSGGGASGPSSLARHGSDGDRRRNKSGGDGDFGRGDRGGAFGPAPRGGHREGAFSDRENPFGGAGNRPDFNQTEGFGRQFPSVGMEENWNHGNRGPGNGGRDPSGLNRGRGGGHSFSGQHGAIDDRRQENIGHRGSEFGLDSSPGGSILGEPQIHERPVPNQGQRNWAGPGNDRPPFALWDQGCNASGSQLQMSSGPDSTFGQNQPLGRGRGLARPGPQHGPRGNFNSGGMGRGRGQFEGSDGRNEFEQEQRTGNMRGHFDNPRMEEFPRADGRGGGAGDGRGFHRGPEGVPTRSGQQSSEHGKRDGHGPYSASDRPPQQTRPEQDRRAWSDGGENRPSYGPPGHWNNDRHQGGPPQRPIAQGDIGNVGQPQPSSRHSDEQNGGNRGGPTFGHIRAAMGPDISNQISGPQTSSGNKGFWPPQGGSMSNEGGPRQSGAFNRSHDPQQGTWGIGDAADVGRQRGPPWDQRGPSQLQPKSQPTSQRGPESGSFNYPPGRDPFGGRPEHARAHLHQGDVQQPSVPLPGLGSGNRGFMGPQEELRRPAHSENDFNQGGQQGIRHLPPHQDAGPSTDFGGHSTGSNLGTNWHRGEQPQVQKKDPPSESMQDLIRRSKQFQSQRRQSPDREQFMNPPNPNATPPSGGGGGGNAFNASSQGASTSSVVTDTSGAPAPDYKALLQYLQFYQKQMGGANPENK